MIETRLNHTWHVKDGKARALDEHHDVAHVQAFMKSLRE